MRLLVRLGVAVVAACLLAQQAIAQDPGVTRSGLDSLRKASGLRVRVKDVNTDGWRTGTLGGVNNGMLILRGTPETRIPTSTVERVQRSMGRRRWDGAVKAFPVGVVLGGATGWMIGHNMGNADQPRRLRRPSVGLAIGAATGGALAALIGAQFFSPERWWDIKIR